MNIYIVLSQTGTLFSRIIRLCTKDPYNHASIALDDSLSVMYSFGRKTRYNMLNCGFILENFNKGLFTYFKEARCCIIEVPVSDYEYKEIKKAIDCFIENQNSYRYNLIGVCGYALGICFKRKNRYFCSQFVSYILKNTHFWNLEPEFTKPMDFFNIKNKRVVYEGKIIDFKGIKKEDAIDDGLIGSKSV